ncbi:MAG TPA: diacylglycerol kinase family lipid kinase [Candidatus Alectryocaccobium stercorigallinarum]|nr:diacylglycerol kinase family lipid kinase [Candidatus Alectryocaccobium stercorigallinarum]
MKKKLLFVYNKKSGKGAIRIRLSDVIDVFSKAGYEIIIHSTQHAHDASEKVLEYIDKVDVVACAGGDGTVNEVITAIMESGRDMPVYYLPSGSTNDYAATLKISRNQLKAAQMAVNGTFKRVDIGKFNDKYFNYVAAFGLLTDISYATDQNLKNKIGYLAYLLEVSKRLFKIPVLDMTVTVDDREYTDGWFYGMVTNSTQVAGVKLITGPNVVLDDGIFEITLVRATKNPVEFLEVLNTMSGGVESKFVVRDKGSRIRVKSNKPITWTLDGEEGGAYMDVTIENMNKALRISVPEPEADIFQDEEEDVL